MSPLLREGDVVSVNGVVLSSPFEFEGTSKIKIRVEPYHDIFVLASDVTVVRPDFRVGDKVQWTACSEGMGSAYTGHILSIANDHLWVDLGDGNFATVWIGKATRVDPEPPTPEPEIITHVHSNIRAAEPNYPEPHSLLPDGQMGGEEDPL